MTAICYVGIEVSARVQYALFAIEVVVLAVFSAVALIRVYTNHALAGTSLHPSLTWFNPMNIKSPGALASGMLLAVFIYWGFDTAASVNEETRTRRTPGRAVVISTFVLLAIYVVVTTATQAFAGVGTTGIGLGNPNNAEDVFNVIAPNVRQQRRRRVRVGLLVAAVSTSAAASTLTTILPTARTTLSMACSQGAAEQFAKVNPRP